MGGNANYTGGLVLQATTFEGTWATVELREDREIAFFNPQMREIGWGDQAEFSIDDLTGAERGRQLASAAPGLRWTAYAPGAFFLVKEWLPSRVTWGPNIPINSEIPTAK